MTHAGLAVGGSKSDRAGDRHSGHCESKPRTAEPKAALAAETMALTRGKDKVKKIVKFGDDESRVIGALAQGRLQDDMAVIRKKIGSGVDVAEVYSPPRIVTVAEAAGLRGVLV